jgi:hypothetical protein
MDNPRDETVRLPIEVLRNCHCPSDGRWTVGDCTDAGTCGCAVNLNARLKLDEAV